MLMVTMRWFLCCRRGRRTASCGSASMTRWENCVGSGLTPAPNACPASPQRPLSCRSRFRYQAMLQFSPSPWRGSHPWRLTSVAIVRPSPGGGFGDGCPKVPPRLKPGRKLERRVVSPPGGRQMSSGRRSLLVTVCRSCAAQAWSLQCARPEVAPAGPPAFPLSPPCGASRRRWPGSSTPSGRRLTGWLRELRLESSRACKRCKTVRLLFTPLFRRQRPKLSPSTWRSLCLCRRSLCQPTALRGSGSMSSSAPCFAPRLRRVLDLALLTSAWQRCPLGEPTDGTDAMQSPAPRLVAGGLIAWRRRAGTAPAAATRARSGPGLAGGRPPSSGFVAGGCLKRCSCSAEGPRASPRASGGGARPQRAAALSPAHGWLHASALGLTGRGVEAQRWSLGSPACSRGLRALPPSHADHAHDAAQARDGRSSLLPWVAAGSGPRVLKDFMLRCWWLACRSAAGREAEEEPLRCCCSDVQGLVPFGSCRALWRSAPRRHA